MCRLGQGNAREWSAVARRSHRGADRADISVAFRPLCLYLKWKSPTSRNSKPETRHTEMFELYQTREIELPCRGKFQIGAGRGGLKFTYYYR